MAFKYQNLDEASAAAISLGIKTGGEYKEKYKLPATKFTAL